MINFYEPALGYLSNYYLTSGKRNTGFGFSFIKRLSEECNSIAKVEKLKKGDLTIAMLATCFRYAGVVDITVENLSGLKLLDDYAQQISCPTEQVASIKDVIIRHSRGEVPISFLDKVVWDALDYRFAMEDLIYRMTLLIDEAQMPDGQHADELGILLKLQGEFSAGHYRTAYAKKHFTECRRKNESQLEKRIMRLSSGKEEKEDVTIMTDKETEDLFKIAFRNYVKLVDVADSKAALLIHVNSILISVVIGFVVSRSEKYPLLTVPSFIILGVAFLTILLSILASRPQSNPSMKDKSAKSHQTFFFGSFDLIGTEFRDADFETYATELDHFFKGGKEKIYQEIYKEVFNVRKVLSKKFTYLSYAYMVFLGGLLLSIVAFFIATQRA